MNHQYYLEEELQKVYYLTLQSHHHLHLHHLNHQQRLEERLVLFHHLHLRHL